MQDGVFPHWSLSNGRRLNKKDFQVSFRVTLLWGFINSEILLTQCNDFNDRKSRIQQALVESLSIVCTTQLFHYRIA